MSSPENPGSERPDPRHRRDSPKEERLSPGELDLTGTVDQDDDLRDVIGDAIVESDAHDTELPHWGARAVARYFANHYQEDRFSSALHHFAATASAEFNAMADELTAIYRSNELPPHVSEWLDRLGTYIMMRTRADYGVSPQSLYRPETQAAIAELGPAFEAFLRLPDVSEDNALDQFHESYYDSYASLDEVAQHVAESHEVWQLLDDASLSHLASPDPKLLLALARQRWDIVQHIDRYYLFEK